MAARNFTRADADHDVRRLHWYSYAKGLVQQEIERALNIQAGNPQDFSVIPVILPGGSSQYVDDFLELRTWVDFSSNISDQNSLHRLVCGIRKIPPGRPPITATTFEDATIVKLRKLARVGHLINDDVRKRHQDKIVEEYLRVEEMDDAKL